MLSIKLQSGAAIAAPARPEGIPEPSAAGTLRFAFLHIFYFDINKVTQNTYRKFFPYMIICQLVKV